MIRFSFFIFSLFFVSQLLAVAPKCRAVGSLTPQFDQLSREAQTFWLRIGEKIREQIEFDFKRPQNLRILKNEIKRGHPYLQFLRSLGFEISPEGIRTPPFPLMLEKLLKQTAVLNQKLHEQGADIQFQPELHLNLIDDTEFKQKVILKPLATFDGSDFFLDIQHSLLPDLAFAKKVARGELPIGGLANASRISRSLMDRQNAPNIMDFLHDFAHLDAFMRQPGYAAAVVRHYRSLYSRWSRLDDENRTDFSLKYIRQGEKPWLRTFLFTEGAWIAKPQFKEQMKQWPLVSELIYKSDITNERSVAQSLKSYDEKVLRLELQGIVENWWQLFEPLGGATNDMISVHTFSSKSQMPIVGALETLEAALDRPDIALRPSTLALVLGVLKYSPELSVVKWEHFVRTPGDENGAMMKLFREMFPVRVLERNSSEWTAMGNLLYKKFGEL